MTPKIYHAPRSKGRQVLSLGSAAHALSGFRRGERRMIATKGQFSLADLALAMLDLTGPANLALMTWAVNPDELVPIVLAAERGRVFKWTLLTDADYAAVVMSRTTTPSARRRTAQLRAMADLVITRNHAKAVVVANAEWALVATGSMNMTRNPRLELVEVEDDAGRASFLLGLIEEMRITCGMGSVAEVDMPVLVERFRTWRAPWCKAPHLAPVPTWE